MHIYKHTRTKWSVLFVTAPRTYRDARTCPLHGIDETAFVQIASVRQRTVNTVRKVDSLKTGEIPAIINASNQRCMGFPENNNEQFIH
jgi:hypothetical protein